MLTDQTLFFASPASFNDAFEFAFPKQDTPHMREKYSKLVYEIMRESGKDRDALISLDKHDFYASMNLLGQAIMSRYEPMVLERNAVTHFYQGYLAAVVGVLCFSANHDNILMWSHYADEHAGFCVQFSTDHLLQLSAEFIGRVSYSRKLPLITADTLDNEERLISMAFTKAVDWAYEEEYRIVATNMIDRVVRFDKAAIRGIYLGCRCTKWKEMIVQVRDDILPNVTIYQAKKGEEQFNLTFEAL